jgi:PIN domain nuclease of toxin-antitoxin system
LNYLLDTHTFLWWVDDSRQLSDISREIIHDGSNRIFLSLVSQWEIAIKTSIGRLEFPINELEDTVE